MTAKQVYSVLNTVSQQIWGETAVTAVDLRGLISMGDTVLSSATSKENFLGVLVDRIGKTIISNRPYSPQVQSFLTDAFTFGAVLQKIYVEPMAAVESKTWDLTAGASVDPFVVSKPAVHQSLFSQMDVWELTVTIPDVQLKSAFTGAEQMAAFISGIFVSLQNSMAVKLEALMEMALCNFIAEKYAVKDTYAMGVVNLLSEYNTATGEALTVTTCLLSPAFLKFSTKTINMMSKRLERESTLFNTKGYKRFTPRDNQKILVLSDFAAAVTSYLESDTYHKEMVSLPNYSEIAYWQGSGTDFGFTSTSKVNVKISSAATDTATEVTGVVALIADVNAIGVTIFDRRDTTIHNPRGEYTNHFSKADVGYYNDLSENGIVFVIAEP